MASSFLVVRDYNLVGRSMVCYGRVLFAVLLFTFVLCFALDCAFLFTCFEFRRFLCLMLRGLLT